jgi:HTH-type transcriptional regulator/antitoxin HigA
MEGVKTMPVLDLKRTASFWPNFTDTLFVPRTENEYNRLVIMLDELIDEVGENEAHPLASLMEIIGVLIEYYENANVPELI